MSAVFATMTDAVFRGLGETITYQGGAVLGIARMRSELIGADTMAIEDRLEVDGRYTDVATPSPGDIVIRSGVTFVVDRITRIDDYVWRATCRAVN